MQRDVVRQQRTPERLVGGRVGAQPFQQRRAQPVIAGLGGPLGQLARQHRDAFGIDDVRLGGPPQRLRCAVEIAGGLLPLNQLQRRPGRIAPPLGILGAHLGQPDQQRFDPRRLAQRDGQIDRLARLGHRDGRGGGPPFQVIEQQAFVPRVARNPFVEREDLDEVVLRQAGGLHQGGGAIQIGVLLQRDAQLGDSRVARVGSRELQRRGAVQRLGGVARRRRLGGQLRQPGGQPAALERRRRACARSAPGR